MRCLPWLLLVVCGCSLNRAPIVPGVPDAGVDAPAMDVPGLDAPDVPVADVPGLDAPDAPNDAGASDVPLDTPDAPCAAGPDRDGDGVVDLCDPCPDDRPDDPDGDGVCTSADVCPAGDDRNDRDADGQPDACDPCPDDAPDDSDGDGTCDSSDVCPGSDDRADEDADGIPDGCDDWPCGTRPTIGLPLTRDEATITSLSIDGGGNTAVVMAGSTMSWVLGYSIVDCGCTGCIDQIEVGLVPGRREFCAYDGNPSCATASTGSRTRSAAVPMASGLYDVRFFRAQDNGCNAMGRTDWWLGVPPADNRIGVICVP